jgi:hypothetical protein
MMARLRGKRLEGTLVIQKFKSRGGRRMQWFVVLRNAVLLRIVDHRRIKTIFIVQAVGRAPNANARSHN